MPEDNAEEGLLLGADDPDFAPRVVRYFHHTTTIDSRVQLPFMLEERVVVDHPSDYELRLYQQYRPSLLPSSSFRSLPKLVVRSDATEEDLPDAPGRLLTRERSDLLEGLLLLASDPPIVPNYSVVDFGGSRVFGPIMNGAIDSVSREPLVISASSLADIQRLVGLTSALDLTRHAPIVRSIELLRDAYEIGCEHPLHTLALFISLEALLTHRPDSSDPYDSVMKQLRRSIPLMMRRAGLYEELSARAAPLHWNKRLSELYGTRSAIAHGGDGRANIRDVRATIRWILCSVLRQSLAEPDLVIDLKQS